MAYVNVPDWKSEQIGEWLRGLDNVVLPYIHFFLKKNINGQQLLDLQPNDLEEIGVHKIGHQEIILEAVDLLKNIYYDLGRENLQLLALRLSCSAHSLHSELWRNQINSSVVSTQVLADVANVVSAVKPLVCWLDRSPFQDQLSYVDKKKNLLKLSLEIAMSGMRDRFVDKPVEYILHSCRELAELADAIIQCVDDSLLLQPASLALATLKKRPGDQLGLYIDPAYHGILQIGELKCNSAAHQNGKIETGDEVVQINYQTVVGWEVNKAMGLLFEETSTEVVMTLKKRPRHSKVFGQIYIKPYRLPCKKQLSYSTRWNDILSPSRPELLSVPSHFVVAPFRKLIPKPIVAVAETQISDATPRVSPPSPTPSTASSSSSRSSESELMAGTSSPNSVRMYLPKPRIPVQRRATITGASPVSKHAPLSLEQFWHELKLEREWRSNSDEKAGEKAHSETQLRRSSPIAHGSLNWSARLCEQVNGTSRGEPLLSENNEETTDNGIIPIKQRIDSLNKAAEQNNHSVKKPKLLPKPVFSNKHNLIKKIDGPANNIKELEINTRRERGKLDKSYSTPSYDYSVDSKESLTFNMKLPEEKVKSAPDNITSEVNSLAEFKKTLEIKSLTEAKSRNEKLSVTSDEEQKSDQNEYLEIRSDGVIEKEKASAGYTKTETTDKVNKILDTINSSLLHSADSESEACSFKSDSPKPPLSAGLSDNVFYNYDIQPEEQTFDNIHTFNKSKDESNRHEERENAIKHASNLPSPTERLVIHTTVNVPATFPRHKIDQKKSSLPPEPPPRPLKGSPIHLKSMSKTTTVSKSSSKNLPHKSPKIPRKKNILLTKRRNISVKDLGICDHEGWLYHRSRSRGSPQWIKGWFIIKGTIFYGFNTPDALRARLMISLPGFTVSPAEEVKSRNYAFKVYYTGTMFYFAAESAENLTGWVESFSRVTVSEEEQSIVMSETDGEEDEEEEAQQSKKDKSNHEQPPHVAAMKKLSGLLSGHLTHLQDSSKGEKRFNSLKKISSRKSNKEDQHVEGSHVASLDRKYLKFLSGSGKQNYVPIPTAQFRSYRRVPPLEKPPSTSAESSLSTDSKSEILPCSAPVPSASPTRPPDMADYRLASLAKCNANSQRTQETAPPGGYMTLESFMLTRQEEERRQQIQHPRSTNILRVPQCHAPPPPTPTASHTAAAVTGLESHSTLLYNSRQANNTLLNTRNTPGKNWTNFSNNNSTTTESTSAEFRSKMLKKTTQYQPPPWEPPNYNPNEESRLQPAFEMTLDRNFSTDSTVSKQRKTDETSGSSLRLKGLFGSGKADMAKTNLLSSPRLKRVLFWDKKQSSNPQQNVPESGNFTDNIPANQLVFNPPHQIVESSLPTTPEYPGLEYPPVFEPGTYSLSDVLRSRRMRTMESTAEVEQPFSRQHEGYFVDENVNGNQNQRASEDRNKDNENNNRGENNETVSDGLFYYSSKKPR